MFGNVYVDIWMNEEVCVRVFRGFLLQECVSLLTKGFKGYPAMCNAIMECLDMAGMPEEVG